MQEEPETSQPAQQPMDADLRAAARVVLDAWDAGRGATLEQMRDLRNALAQAGRAGLALISAEQMARYGRHAQDERERLLAIQLGNALGLWNATIQQVLEELRRLRAVQDALLARRSPADLETQRLANEAMAGATQWTPLR
jgi:hypothetical protein